MTERQISLDLNHFGPTQCSEHGLGEMLLKLQKLILPHYKINAFEALPLLLP